MDFARTAFSRSRPNDPEKDIFNSIRMDEALSVVIKELIHRNRIDPIRIGNVITGCAFQAVENWLYGGRHPVLLAELPVEIPGLAIDMACSSSMMAAIIGALAIKADESKIVLAGGMEHMTHVPINNNPHIIPNHRLLVRPEYAKYMMNIGYNMGLTAEKLAEENGIGRVEMDEFALRSHRLAAESQELGWFNDEIHPIQVEHNNEMIVVGADQSIRSDTTKAQIMNLPPVFRNDGVITAGNSSPINAGASVLMIMSEEEMRRSEVAPIAKIKAFSWTGVDPSSMGKGPIPASRKALEKAGLDADEIDYWEINEAFAVVVLYGARELEIDLNRVNVHGGAIAIGHPLGASGARIMGTLARILQEKHAKFGVATVCVGGGQGVATVLERV